MFSNLIIYVNTMQSSFNIKIENLFYNILYKYKIHVYINLNIRIIYYIIFIKSRYLLLYIEK